SDEPMQQTVVLDESGECVKISFTNIQYGKICGYKFFDANINGIFDVENETGIPNWRIELRDVNGSLIAWTYTDETGYYCFCNLTLGIYNVTEIMECGWINITSTFYVVIGNVSGFELAVNFGNVVCGPPGHTIGFWKNNIIKNVNGWTKGIQVSMDQLKQFIFNIDAKYGGDFDFLNLTDADIWENITNADLLKAYNILSIPDASNPMLKAQAQILSLLLTEQLYGEDYSNAWVYLPDLGVGTDPWFGHMSDAIAFILDLYSDGYYTAAQKLADYLNNLPESCVWKEYL
ncbi:MAG: SdrD B-like domain-containing protein, partial [Methanomassiliicoccales archaeon]